MIAETIPGSGVGAGFILIMSLVACLTVEKVNLIPESIWLYIFFAKFEIVISLN